MADLFENPIGTDGFEFVEFTSPEPEKLAAYFEQIGFTAVGKHRSQERRPLQAERHQLHPQHGAEPASPPISATRTAPAPTPWRSA